MPFLLMLFKQCNALNWLLIRHCRSFYSKRTQRENKQHKHLPPFFFSFVIMFYFCIFTYTFEPKRVHSLKDLFLVIYRLFFCKFSFLYIMLDLDIENFRYLKYGNCFLFDHYSNNFYCYFIYLNATLPLKEIFKSFIKWTSKKFWLHIWGG